jgi:hypothetical protein
MGIIAGILGSGAGAIIIGCSFIAMMHLSHLPGVTHPWIRRLLIVAMYCGGATLAYSEVGAIWSGLVNRIADLFGGLGSGLPFVILVVGTAALTLGTVVALAVAPVDQAIITAAFLPALLMLVPGGLLHEFFVATAVPGQALAQSFTTWLAG